LLTAGIAEAFWQSSFDSNSSHCPEGADVLLFSFGAFSLLHDCLDGAAGTRAITGRSSDVGDANELYCLNFAIRLGEPDTVVACVCDVKARKL